MRLPDGLRRSPSAVLIGVVLLLLVGFGFTSYSENQFEERSRQEATVQAAMLAASVSAALEFGDASIARENVRSLSANPSIDAAGVYDSAGRGVAGYARDGRPLPISPPVGAGPEGDRLAITVPVTASGEAVGSVYVRTSLEPFAQRLARYGGIMLLAIMGGLVAIVVAVSAAAQRRANAALRAEIAEREAAEERLRQAQKMQAVGQLTGGIAHDFNNLLTPIMGGLEIIATMTAEPRTKSLASNALEAARRGAKLTGQLLAFSRTHRLSTSAVPVNDLIGGMQDLMRHTIGPEIAIKLALDPACGTAQADPNQIENAILNLAINARDAMPDGGTLTLSTARETIADDGELAAGDYVAILIADTGTGMTPEVLARATEPFFTTKEVGKGTGLGLAQVYGVAHQFGGTLRIDSEVGVGTTMRILLPAATTATEAVATAAETPLLDGHGSGDILVIDDDADVRTFLASTLESLGYRVRTADHGEEGLQLLDEDAPDLLMVDYAMPGLNGAEVAKQVREAHPSLPIVFITGHADTEALTEAIGPGAPILHKPFGARDLAAIVERHVSQPQSHAAE
ncbi:response regulator [Sphingoaurantiacus capsulatus]|uniref:histidine kinase n=1 Tax=Sphingoaurantiacus capsulatus TaxID=1771310 RepID=A0ABV7X709_9SPHN